MFSPLLRSAPAGVATGASTAPATRASWAAAVLVTVAAASVLAGVLHLALSGEHFATGLLSGASFLAIGLAQLAWAALAALRPARRLLLGGAALHGTAILAWAGAESGLLGFLHVGGHHGQGPAWATVVAEAVVVAGCLAVTLRRRRT